MLKTIKRKMSRDTQHASSFNMLFHDLSHFVDSEGRERSSLTFISSSAPSVFYEMQERLENTAQKKKFHRWPFLFVNNY